MDIYTTIELGIVILITTMWIIGIGIVILKGIKDKKRLKSKGLIKRGSEWPE